MLNEIEISVGDLVAFFIGFFGGFVWDQLTQPDTSESESQRMLTTAHERIEPEQEFWQPEEEYEDVYLVSEAEYEATQAACHPMA